MSGIYKGYNPVYESLKREIFEAESKVDLSVLARTIYDTFANVVMNSSDEAIKTPDGFKAFMDKVLQSSSLESIKAEFHRKMDAIAASDKVQAESINASKSYLDQLFEQLTNLVGKDSKGMKSVLGMMSGFVGSTVTGLQGVQAQLAQNESLVSKYLTEAEDELTGEEANSEEGLASKWYTQLSKNLLDSATSFAGETSAAMSNKNLAGDAGIVAFSESAQKYLDQAKDLAITSGRKGILKLGKLQTASGPMKGKDYKVKAQNLINEIIRQREEFQKLKYRLSNIPAPPNPIVVCPAGMVFDKTKNACVFVTQPPVPGQETPPKPPSPQPTPTPTPGNNCQFPVNVGAKKCSEVENLQNKLISMDPCIAQIINKAGGADGRYGKVTAKLANIANAYLTGANSFDAGGSLTKEMFDNIMRGSAMPVPPAAAKESLDINKIIENKIFEREYQFGPVLSFDDFSSAISESFEEITEDTPGVKAPPAPPVPPVPAPITTTKTIGSCICKTYADGVIDPECKSSIVPVPPVPVPPNPEEEEIKIPGRDDWKGLKYVDTGSYPISFDESLLSAWSKEAAMLAIGYFSGGSSYLLRAGSAGIKSLGIKGASKLGLTKLAQRIGATAVGKVAATATARTAARLGSVSAGYFAKYGAIPIAKRVAGGLIAGTVGSTALDFLAGRNSYVVTVTEGYIERTNLLGLVKGMVDTIDGYVSDDDWATITTVLAVIKGAWTTDESDKAVSAWGELKRLYAEAEGEDLVADIMSVSAKMGDVEGYPKIKSLSPLSSVQDLDWDLAAAETKKFAEVLDKNEGTLTGNISKLPDNYVQAFVEGKFVEVDEEGNVEGEEGSGAPAEEETSTKKGL
jgi:hypothetical protein